MNKTLLTKIKKDKNIINELRRAHLIIAVLAFGVGLLTGVLIKADLITHVLGSITIALVSLVGLISLFVVVKISK